MQAYGYIRVSSVAQNESRQVIEMKKAGVPEGNMYLDKESGKNFVRKNYQKLLKRLKEGDVLFVLSIDRLGRNYEEILEQWRYLTKIKKIDISILDMPILDTRIGKNLMGTFLSDIVLQVLSFVAENERDSIRKRQEQGIAAARAKGTRFGRPEAKLPDDFDRLVKSWRSGEMKAEEVATICNISIATLYNKMKKMS